MILNAWNGVWPDTYILQIIIPQELEKLQRFCKKLAFKNTKFIVKVRDIHKTEKNNSIGISVFGYDIQSMSQIILSKDINLLLIVEEAKRHYVLIKYFNICMYDHTLHQLICADFQSILVPEDNGKQNSNESDTNKYKQMLLPIMVIN